MAITFDGQNDKITTSSQVLNVPQSVAGTFSAGGLAIGAGSTTLVTTTSGKVAIGTATISSSSSLSSLIVNGPIESLRDAYGEGGQITLRAQSGGIYRWNVDNSSTSSTFRIFREDDATAANGLEMLKISSSGNVTKPYQSFCDTGDTTTYNGAGSLCASPASAKGNWSSTVANTGNNFSTSTDLYTCPASGVYAISCTCSIDNLTPAPYRTIFVLSFNGGYEEITEVFDTYENQSPCVIRQCAANDTIGLGINGTGGSSFHVRLQVYFLG
jgi:hypothetical protein